MKALVFVEERRGFPLVDSVAIVTHLAAEGHAVSAAYAASDSECLLDGLARCGAERVFVAGDPRFTEYPVAARVDLLAWLCRTYNFDTVVLPTTVIGSDIAGGLSAELGAGVGWGIFELSEDGSTLVGRRQTLWDSVIVEMEWTSPMRLVMMRPNACVRTVENPSDCEMIYVSANTVSGARRCGGADPTAVSGLATAKTIVAGGRGLGKAENLNLLRDLADALDGTIGVSLPVVEAGWAPRSMQVGQTGTIIHSRLYIACGISGQFQHKIGIEGAGTIIAINSDANAPIMRFCDLAVVGDLTTLLPRLTALIKERRSNPASSD